MSAQKHQWVRGEGFPIRDAEFLDAMCGAKMPHVLLGEGDRPDAFEQPRVAIVGTRAATPCGLEDARELAEFCARAGITVVSGLAIGVDAAAHEGALAVGGLTVGVVATGLDIVYPRRHENLYRKVRAQGLVVGENGYGTQPVPWRFPIRNRIIAALADAVVIVEATRKGGALHTAKYALDFGRTLLALPGSRRNPASEGCNELLRDGAQPLLDPTDLLVAIGRGEAERSGWQPGLPLPLAPDETAVLRALAGEGASIDEIEQRVTVPAERLGAALRNLERSGRLTRRRGLWWPA